MKNAFRGVLTLILLTSVHLYAYTQCCPEIEKVGQRDQFLYESDDIQMDIYTDPNNDWLHYINDYTAPQTWEFNKFVRVRAWSNRSENTDNYIQLYWWIGDGNNTALVQNYANGIGPKAGTYTLTRPGCGMHNFGGSYLYYWSLIDIPTEKPTLLSYRIHEFMSDEAGVVWVSPFSSYVSQGGDLSNNNTNYVIGTEATGYITHFNSLSVTVDTGDDGNIYIQIGGQDCNDNAAVTIGRKTRNDLHHLSITVTGGGKVGVGPLCDFYETGQTVTLKPLTDDSSVYFDKWSGTDAGYIVDNGDGTYTITIQNFDMSIQADFETILEVQGTFAIDNACGNDKALTAVFTRTQGHAVTYDLLFSQEARAQGFADLIGQAVKDTSVFEWTIEMPANQDNPLWYVRPDVYGATLVLTDNQARQTSFYTTFSVLYPSWVILQRWNDVLTITNNHFNGGYNFTHVQWYVNDQPVEGRGDYNSYYYAGDGQRLMPGTSYRAELTRADDGLTFSTCEYLPIELTNEVLFKDNGVKMAPRYTGNSHEAVVTTKLSGKYIVYDISGREVTNGWFGAEYGEPDIVFPETCQHGTYVIRFVPDNAKDIYLKWLLY